MHRLPPWLFPTNGARRGRRFVTGHGLSGSGLLIAAWLVLSGAIGQAGIRTSADLLGANAAVAGGLLLAVTTLRRVGVWVSPEQVTVIGAFGLWSRSFPIVTVAQVFVVEPRWRQPSMLGFRLRDGRVVRAPAICAPMWGSTDILVERGEEVGRVVAAARPRSAV